MSTVQIYRAILFPDERASDCCLTPNEQSFSYIMAGPCYISTLGFRWWWWCLLYTRPTHL